MKTLIVAAVSKYWVNGAASVKSYACYVIKMALIFCLFSSGNAICAVQGEWGKVSRAKIRVTVEIVDKDNLKVRDVYKHGVCTKPLGESKVIRENSSLKKVTDCLAVVQELEIDNRNADLIRVMPI